MLHLCDNSHTDKITLDKSRYSCYTVSMERIREIIAKAYPWTDRYDLLLDWCQMALDNGMSSTEVYGFILDTIQVN
jgi:hypothetical protein